MLNRRDSDGAISVMENSNDDDPCSPVALGVTDWSVLLVAESPYNWHLQSHRPSVRPSVGHIRCALHNTKWSRLENWIILNQVIR